MNGTENSDNSTLQNAFIKGLPSFSLPPNLNSKLVTNKKKKQPSRPRLSNLRSTWLSTQSIEEDVFSEDKLIDITLPPLNLQENNLLENEIHLLVTIATCFSLATPILASILASNLYLNSMLIGVWVILITWYKVGGTDDIKKQLQGFILTCIFMLLFFISFLSYNENALFIFTTIVSIILYCLAHRLNNINQLVKSQQQELHSNHQHIIEQALTSYYERRHMFLTTVSQEIRDASLMVIATLEQFSPSSILSNSHELLSACSIAVPIASITAINTTIKQACHISSHLNLISRMLREVNSKSPLSENEKVRSIVKQEFDVSELIQNVGDSLAGMSAKLGVHFVIYHTDNGLYYSNVIGDQDAIKHALINLLRNILEGCTPGACIELGLYIATIPDTPKVRVTFDIIQTASPAIPLGVSGAMIPNANFTAQLLSYIGGTMNLEDLGKNRTRVEVSIELLPGCNSDQRLLMIEKPSQILEKQFSNIRFSNEPTLEDLSSFITQLKGVKMILHAQEKSIFAKHLTSCLTSWNTDISHVPVLSYTDDDTDSSSVPCSDSDNSPIGTTTSTPTLATTISNPLENTMHSVHSPSSNRTSSKVPSPVIEEDHIHSIPPAFILIDDDVLTLEKKLREFRDQPSPPPAVLQQQHRRHRRSKSRNHGDISLNSTVAVVFFTCLSNYKRVRDIIHWISSMDLPPTMPRVVVVPKPAGPRRFLTALHTAWNNAIVEPQFIPIATSPLSPFIGIHGGVSTASAQEINSTGTVTPGGTTLMTPHDNTTRFSPGRRNLRVNSPLGVEVEKGNYFFDPVIANRSPATPSQNTPGTPNDVKRRLRSHSNSFIPSSGTRRAMLDLSLSSPVKATPVQELDELNHHHNPGTSMDTARPLGSNIIDANTNSMEPLAPTLLSPAVIDAKPTETIESTDTKPTPAEKPKQKLTFIISNRKRKEKSKKSDKPSPPITVLIVEDNMINQAILSTWMKKHKIKFSVACDGKEAVEKWKGGGFHLILMDIQLPVMNGIDATKMIRDIEKERKIGVLPSNHLDITPIDSKASFQSPVIIVALTASSLESDRQAALAAGCNDFLTKPVSLEWLEKKITEWGCMQALIDFEGWRKWKRSTDGSPQTAAATASAALKSKLKKEASMANGTALLKEEEANTIERENLNRRTKDALKDVSNAIVLVGINKKRANSNSIDQIKEPSTIVPQKIRNRNTDSQYNIHKQLQEREQKRLLEQERLTRLEEEEDEDNV